MPNSVPDVSNVDVPLRSFITLPPQLHCGDVDCTSGKQAFFMSPGVLLASAMTLEAVWIRGADSPRVPLTVRCMHCQQLQHLKIAAGVNTGCTFEIHTYRCIHSSPLRLLPSFLQIDS